VILDQRQVNDQIADRYKIDNEPLPVNERLRENDIPSGLKNIGNTCYFASLIQALYHLPNFQEKILNFDMEKHLSELKDIDQSKEMDEVEKLKMRKSRELVQNL